MAYNPFNIFRRNQKALFAVLTVFIMIMFTLSSGVAGGDFFDTFSRWLGAKGSKEAVCKIDGHAVTVNELDGGPRSVQFKRVMANRFMYYAASQASSELLNYANQQRPRLSPAGQEMADGASGMLGLLGMLNDPRFRNSPQAMGMLSRVGQVEQEVQRMATAPEGTVRAEDRDVAAVYKTVFNLYGILQGGNEHYFFNAPNRTRRDLIEFLLWEKKADQLGIRFSKDDAKRLIQTEFYNFFKDDSKIRAQLQKTQGFNMDACLEAIATEFKVRAAQAAVLGNAGKRGGAPAFTTPYETFEFYREQTSPAIYEVISVPAAGFVDRVPGQPSESEIADLYKKYADDEPNPRKDTPGFKEPRKLSIAFFGVTGEEPYYKKLAEEQIKVGEVMAKASGALTTPLPGAMNAWVAAAAAPLTLKEPAVAAAYAGYTSQFKNVMKNEYSSSLVFTRDILETHWAKPGTAAAAVGAFVGQSAGMGHPAAAAAITMTAPIAYEQRSRAAVGTPLVLGWVPGPGLMPNLVGAVAFSAEREPKPLPIESQRAELLKNTITSRAKALAFGASDPMSFAPPGPTTEKGDLERFIEELKKLSENDKPKDRAATDKYIKDFLAARGIAGPTASTAPRDEFSIEDDPALAPLVKAQKDSLRAARGAHGMGPEPYMPFGQSFFWTSRFDGAQMRRVPTSGTFLGELYPPRDRGTGEEGRVHYVYWRTEDVPAKKTTASAARPAVIAAWKRMKARELANARANALSDAIRATPSTDPALLTSSLIQKHFELQAEFSDPKAKERTKRFTINGVAPLTSGPMNPMTGQGGGLMQFQLPDSDNIPFTTGEMEKLLIDNRDKPAKTVLVFTDSAKDNYYVATLIRRDMRTPGEFKSDVYSQFGRSRQILQMAQGDAAGKARASVLELLKKEFKYEETEEQKKKLDENAKSGGRSDF